MNFLLGAWRAYSKLLDVYPVRTKGITTALIVGVGDVVGQKLQQQEGDKWDIKRTMYMAGYGGCYLAPCNHFWIRFLEKMIPRKTLPNVFLKVIVDASTAGPFLILCYFASRGIYAGENVDQIQSRIKDGFVPVWQNAVRMWPAAQLFNFYFIPEKYRVLYISILSFGWNTYLGMAISKNDQKKKNNGEEANNVNNNNNMSVNMNNSDNVNNIKSFININTNPGTNLNITTNTNIIHPHTVTNSTATINSNLNTTITNPIPSLNITAASGHVIKTTSTLTQK
eukprot:TRINITY_DN3581_c0_g1_i1.p1 TRINITY_DN3581_c0_g1~~TRINITY_DN3581_c0_g1_i1.p1  ORF type:complete len:282 (+),score=70.34 TRINITY_DN3581_c0_g1_i1:201-1046(+)